MITQKTLNIEAARKRATRLHADQFRRDGVTPYIEHPAKVAEIVEKLGGDEDEIVVAWLHDTLEDTDATFEDLSVDFGKTVADAVLALTHLEGESYPDAIIRAGENRISRRVKIADNLANLSDSPSRNQVKKYSASLIKLLSQP